MDAEVVRSFRDKVLQQPEVFFTPNDEVAAELKAFTKHVFDRCTKFVSRSSATPLDQLYVDGFDADQVWEQLRLQNEPLVAELAKRIRGFHKQPEDVKLFPGEKTEEKEEEESDEGDSAVNEGSDSEAEADDKESDESASESDDSDDDAAEPEKEAEAKQKKSSSKKKQKKKARDVAEDGFFDWDEMDKAAEEEELSDGDDDVDMEGDDDNEGDDDVDSGDGEDDDDDDDEDEEDSNAGDAKDMHYNDFFDEPEGEKDGNSDEDEEDEEGDEEEDESMPVDDDDEEYPSIKRAEVEDDGEPADEDDLAERGIMSSHQRQRQRLQQQIKDLEEEALGEKTWLMKGEVRSGARPENSLLEAVLDYERPVKSAPVVTVEASMALEDMIKKRILDDNFDDVIRKFAANEGDEKKKLEDVSMEKSKEGLGELYEKDYMKTAMGFEADDESKKDQEEIDVLFKSLCWKLDALSNYHFTPKPIVKELQIKPAVAAIAMEEVVPISVSDANMRAPEEVFDKKRKRGEAVLQSRDEMSQTERKALRNAKKQSRRKENRQREADERLVAKLNPGLGNKYEKKKLLESLASAKNVTTGKAIEGSTKQFSNSKEFFSKLQDEVQSEIRRKTE